MSTTTLDLATSSGDRVRRLIRGRDQDPGWYRPLLIALLAATAIAYIVNLTASDYANSFYAAAVQASTKSWKAFFFGSLDSSNFITVDKPPASLWMMGLSGRIFGFSSASMLIPEVLEGVISAGLLSAAVKRWYGAGAGLLAGLVMVITPVAALMFRFNNPDALMVCLLVTSAYCLTRATEAASTKWMLGVGVCIGFAFLAKMMEAFVVLPGFALVYVVAAPTTWKRRIVQLLIGGIAIVVSAGWWVAIVALWPASSRPMVDGSPTNSILNLIFGYNGIGRLTGNEGGFAGPGAGGAIPKAVKELAGKAGPGLGGGAGGMFGGSSGITRLFNSSFGAQASWLILTALVVLVGGLIWRWLKPRTDPIRAGLLLWGTLLVVSGLVFSFSKGIIHEYYTVELVPGIAALVAIGAAELWKRRDLYVARGMMAALVAISAGSAVVLLGRDSSWESWLTPLVIAAAAVAIIGLLVPTQFFHRAALPIAVIGGLACLAAPLAYAADTIGSAHTGAIPVAGPEQSAGMPGGPGPRSGFPGFGGGAPGSPSSSSGSSSSDPSTTGFPPIGAGGFGGGGPGDIGTTKVPAALVKLLEGSKGYRWAAITDGSQSAASLELASNGAPIAAIGGFDGEGGLITLAQFEKYVKAGDIHYYIASSGGPGGFGGSPGGTTTGSDSTTDGAAPTSGGSSSSGLSALFGADSSSSGTASSTGGFPGPSGSGFGMNSGSEQKIEQWVKAHYKSETVGGETVYNLSEPTS
jgi:4-amino-4-deoxy-L-arabinose transferase-like glycosyltransferase